jgi:outer membrane protein OmpA-like peptidoglycan-associated protein
MKGKSMNRIWSLLFFLVLGSGVSWGQYNLVSNYSFEELVELPVQPNPRNTFEYEPNSGFEPFRKNLKFWFAGTLTTPDLRIFNQARYSDCNRLFDDCDKPHTGNMMVGIITSMTNTYTDSYREYVQIKLNRPLVPGEMVEVEWWVRKERDAKLVSNNIGIHFSLEKIFEETEEVLDLKPQINIDTLINSVDTRWVKLTGKFKPARPYRYMLLGNFFKNEETITQPYANFSGTPYVTPYAYYLIDDIKIIQPGVKPTLPKLSFSWPAPGETMILDDVHFETDSASLDSAAIAGLNDLLEALQRDTTMQIEIHGHTDEVASTAYNLDLSKRRAQAVVNYLVQSGIRPARLQAKGFGESQPIADNTTKEGRAENRRVELMVVQEPD